MVHNYVIRILFYMKNNVILGIKCQIRLNNTIFEVSHLINDIDLSDVISCWCCHWVIGKSLNEYIVSSHRKPSTIFFSVHVFKITLIHVKLHIKHCML